MSYSSDRITTAFHQVRKDVATLLNPKTYEHLSQNQIIGALTVLLLVVGVSVGVYLGGQGQETRKQAQVYCIEEGGTCFPGSVCCGANTCDNHICTNPNQNCVGELLCKGVNQNCCPGMTSIVDSQCSSGFRCVQDPTLCKSSSDSGNCTGKHEGQACTRDSLTGICGFTNQTTDSCECVLLSQNPCEDKGGTCYFGYTDCRNLGLEKPSDPDMTCPQDAGSPIFNLCCVAAAPTNTSVPRNTNTPVPNTPGQPTNTPVPNPTNTSVPNTPRPTNTPGGPTNTPRPTNTVTPTYTPGGPTITPTNTPVIAPVCVNVTLNNPAASVPNTPPKIGDIVTMTCSQVAGATRYEFRVKLPNGSYVSVDPSLTTPYVSQQLTISTAGVHVAACRPCATVDSTSCAPWEN